MLACPSMPLIEVANPKKVINSAKYIFELI